MGSLVAELAEKLSSATNNFDIDSGTIYVNTSADTVGIGTTTPGSKLDVQGTMQVGVDDTGHDVKFFGATAGAYLEWDESADELEIRGGAATPGKLLLSTAETTVVDGNKLGQIDFQAPLEGSGSDAILVTASFYAESNATFSETNNATDLVFATGASEAATEKVRITSDGRVGIGTSNPLGDLVIIDSSTGTGIEITAEVATGTNRITNYDRVESAYKKFRLDASEHNFYISGNSKVLIDSSGNVGIGTSTPGTLLELAAAADWTKFTIATYSDSQTHTPTIYLEKSHSDTLGTNTATVDDEYLGEIRFAGFSNDNTIVYSSIIRAIQDGSPSTTTIGTDLEFYTQANGSAMGDARMIIKSSGYVGIGTTAPETNLNIVHSHSSTIDAVNQITRFPLAIRNTNTGSEHFTGIAFTINSEIDNDSIGAAIYAQRDSSATSDTSLYDTNLMFATNDASDDGNTVRMTVTHDGNVGIGTTAPSEKLSVKGTVGFETTDSTNKWVVYAHTDDTLRFNYNGAGNDEITIDSTGNVGIGTTSPYSPLHVHGKTMGTFGVGECVFAKQFNHHYTNNMSQSLGINYSELSQAGTVFHFRFYGAMDTLVDMISFTEIVCVYRNDAYGLTKVILNQKSAVSNNNAAAQGVYYDIDNPGASNAGSAITITSSVNSGTNSGGNYDIATYVTIHRVDARASGAMFKQS